MSPAVDRLGAAEQAWSLMQRFVGSHSRHRDLADALGFSLGAGRGKVLLQLRGGPSTLSQLAEAHGYDAPYATLVVDKLEAHGLVERRPHPDDRRRRLVALTDAGQAAVATVDAILLRPPPAVGALPAADLRALTALLARLSTPTTTTVTTREGDDGPSRVGGAMRIFLTGGSGKAGRHVAPFLAEQGHQVTNADLVPLGHPDVFDFRVDLTDPGETYSALTGLASLDELDLAEKPSYDAVVHFAAIPAIGLRSDVATYTTNILSTYNVLEAATRLGIGKVVFASSETTYGVCFAQGERRPLYVPVDEEHPTVPEDSYAMSKVAGEATARSFQARTGSDVYGLRINNVIEPHEYAELFPAFLEDPSLRRRNFFAYIDTRDLGHMVQCCLETDGLGYQVFNVANPDMSVAATTQEIVDRFYDGVEVRRELGRDETFYAIDKARRLLGYAPTHSWRDVLTDPVSR